MSTDQERLHSEKRKPRAKPYSMNSQAWCQRRDGRSITESSHTRVR